MGSVIHIDNLTVTYRRHPVVHHVSAEIQLGSLTAIVGPNGAGKSTLLNTLAGLQRPSEGRIDGYPRHSVGYLPQHSQLDRSFPLNVLELVTVGLWRQIGPLGRVRASQRASVTNAIEQVGLAGFEKRTIGSLSGGQFQRALFARLIVQDTPIILLDEPFNAIDQNTVNALLALLKDWHGQARTLVVVTHDIEQVHEHFPETLLLARELVGHGHTSTVLTQENLRRAKTLCEAFDDHAPVCLRGAA